MLENNKQLFGWKIQYQQHQDYTAHPIVPKIIIPKVEIPCALYLALKKQHFGEKVPIECRDYIKCIESLSDVKNIEHDKYLSVFKICLYLEQYQSDLELKKLKMKNYNIVKVTSDKCFIIKVPALDNENPVITINDSVTLYDVITKEKYRAKVTQVAGKDVTVQLEDPVAIKMKTHNKKFNIKFQGQHWPLRCCHYALSLASKFNFLEIMYPQHTIHNMNLKYDIDWKNTDIKKNEQQKQAVIKILHMTASPAPYIIFGPPGTGKTVTLVEAIYQIVKQNNKNNVLVCTSSNTAADDITQKLIKYLPAEIIYRMYAPSRHWENVKTDIQKCANFVNGTIIFLPKEILMMKKIIISTLITSVRLAAVRFRENHFSHIIIDEASQVMEPEMLVPITLTKNNIINDTTNFQPQIVIAGDHYQLGPVVRSKFAKNILGKSMLERLMTDCDLYKKKDGKYNPNYVTKLVNNYRSHKHILHVSNTHFYDGDLVYCEQHNTKIALNWNKLPGKKFPIIFQDVLGLEERTTTKSVYNTAEVLVVMQYVKMLMNAKLDKYRISEKDIGIITPFKKQQLNIMQKLAITGWEGISVGTVETFQGQERTVIIVSTVRSQIFTHDGVEHIGFLSNEKRFNVAVTRAKALLIIVGNSKIICTNKHWKALWEYCKEHGGYIPFNQCPLHPNILKKYNIASNDANEENITVNEVSVTVETDVKGKKKKLDTLTNVLVHSIKKNLTLTK